MLFAALFRLGELGADNQVFDGDFTARFFVGTLNDDTGRVAPVGIFHLRTEFSLPEIKLGADAGVAELGHHVLIVGNAVLFEYRRVYLAAFRREVTLAGLL